MSDAGAADALYFAIPTIIMNLQTSLLLLKGSPWAPSVSSFGLCMRTRVGPLLATGPLPGPTYQGTYQGRGYLHRQLHQQAGLFKKEKSEVCYGSYGGYGDQHGG